MGVGIRGGPTWCLNDEPKDDEDELDEVEVEDDEDTEIGESESGKGIHDEVDPEELHRNESLGHA